MVLTIRKKTSGQVIDAVLKTANKSEKLTFKQTKFRNSLTSKIQISESSKPSLTFEYKQPKCKNIFCFSPVTISAVGKKLNYRMVIDFKSIVKRRGKFLVPITVKHNKKSMKGFLNLDDNKVMGLKGVSLMDVLSDEQKTLVNDFKGPLKTATKFYLKELESIRKTKNSVMTAEGHTQNGIVGDLCKGSITGISGGAAAACCLTAGAVTVGTACVLCAGVVAGGGWFAAKLCPD